MTYRCIVCGEELGEWQNSCLSLDVRYECDNKDCPIEGVSLSQEQARVLNGKRGKFDRSIDTAMKWYKDAMM